MSIFQIAAILFALIMIYIIDIHKKTATITAVELWIWRSLWIIFIILALFPESLLGIVHLLQFTRVFDLLVIIAFMVLTFLVIVVYLKQREISKQLETSIRQEAIDTYLQKQAVKK